MMRAGRCLQLSIWSWQCVMRADLDRRLGVAPDVRVGIHTGRVVVTDLRAVIDPLPSETRLWASSPTWPPGYSKLPSPAW